jgi:Zn-finger protein
MTNLIHIRQARGGTLCGKHGPSVNGRWRRKATCEACLAIHDEHRTRKVLDELTREAERLGLYGERKRP